MKKRHYISLAILLAGFLASAAVLRHPRQLSLEECSPEYLRYKDAPGIRASFVKNFPINDTLAVNVLLLQATDSVGWETLTTDFRIPSLPEESTRQKIEQGKDVIGIHLALKGNPSLPMDTVNLLNNNIIAVSRLHKTVSVFYQSSEPVMNAIVFSQFDLGIPNNI